MVSVLNMPVYIFMFIQDFNISGKTYNITLIFKSLVNHIFTGLYSYIDFLIFIQCKGAKVNCRIRGPKDHFCLSDEYERIYIHSY